MKYFAQLSHLVGPLAVLAWLLPGAAPLAASRPNVVVILNISAPVWISVIGNPGRM